MFKNDQVNLIKIFQQMLQDLKTVSDHFEALSMNVFKAKN